MSQKEKILEALESGVHLTPLEAMRYFGCIRLAARISELREDGYNIETNLIQVRTRFVQKVWVAKYVLRRKRK